MAPRAKQPIARWIPAQAAPDAAETAFEIGIEAVVIGLVQVVERHAAHDILAAAVSVEDKSST